MQKHPRESDSTEIRQRSTLAADFQQEMAFVSDLEKARRYAGQWVALAGDRVLAAGSRPREVLAEAKKQGYSDPLLHYFPVRDPDTMFWGGWS